MKIRKILFLNFLLQKKRKWVKRHLKLTLKFVSLAFLSLHTNKCTHPHTRMRTMHTHKHTHRHAHTHPWTRTYTKFDKIFSHTHRLNKHPALGHAMSWSQIGWTMKNQMQWFFAAMNAKFLLQCNFSVLNGSSRYLCVPGIRTQEPSREKKIELMPLQSILLLTTFCWPRSLFLCSNRLSE